MSVDFKAKSYRVASQGISETALSGRRLAAIITGGAAALAMVLATAIPVKAEKNDLAKALIAALVVGAIAHELKDKDRPAPVPVPLPEPEPVKAKRVPSVCAISIDGAERSVTLYPESCLREEGFTYRLPRHCANTATIFGQRDRVYSTQCLREAGFRFSGR